MTAPQARAAAVCALILVGGSWLIARQQTATQVPFVFRSGTELVQVDASVLDSHRRPVKGLTATDFTVFEDGKPRPVETFTEVNLPPSQPAGEAAWMAEVPTDVVTNRAIGQEGRLVVILMDRTIPVGPPTLTAREVATTAVNALGPSDMAALVSTSGGVPQNFTSDRSRLLRAINQRDWSTGISAEASEIEDKVLAAPGVFSALTDPRCLCGLCVLDTVTRIAGALQDVPRRRKSLLFIGSDFVVQAGPQPPQGELGCGIKLKDARDRMFAALDRSGVIVHTFDPSGLGPVGAISQASSTLRAVQVNGAQTRAIVDTLSHQNSLSVLPDYTGGSAVMNTNAPQARIPDIMRESQSYYLLGFRPADPDPSRPVHAITVKVNRRNVDVHARRQFSTPATSLAASSAAPATSPAIAALTALLPEQQLPLDLHVAAFATPGAVRPTVAVAVGINAFAPPSQATDRNTPLNVVVVALDPTGKPRASARQAVNLSWPVTGPGATRRVEALTRLALDPGDYEIRVAVENEASHQASSAFSYITVPPFSSVPLSLSTMVIDAPPTTSSVPREALQGLLPVSPTTERSFKREQAVSTFMRIYQGTARADALAPVSVRVRIMDTQNRILRDQVVSLSASAFQAGRAADCRIALPLTQLEPGDYLLRLEATMGERVAGRVIRFSVE